MKEITPLDKALGLLSLPIFYAALGLYALNTLVLQPLSPYWLTGKLGDMAWMFLAPVALTAVFALFLSRRRKAFAFPFAAASVALAFILLKATPLHTGIVWTLEQLTGRPVSVVRDASDLLALLALPAVIWLWYRQPSIAWHNRRSGAVVMMLLAFLTLADMAAPNLGITSIELGEGKIIACDGYYGSFQSEDGGQMWKFGDTPCEEVVTSPKFGEVIQDSMDKNIQYRFSSGFIERSVDAGQTWQVDYKWSIPSEAAQTYYIIKYRNWSAHTQTPFSAAIEPDTGTVYFAMGHEGILKRAPGTRPEYTWIAVGNYKKMTFRQSELIFNLLYGEWILAFAAGGAGMVLLDRKFNPGKIKTVLLVLCAIVMIVCALLFPPAPTLATPYFGPFIQMGLLGLAVLMLILTINAFVNMARRSKSLLYACIVGIFTIPLLSFLPYALWTYNIIRSYQNAAFSAVTIAVLSIIGFQFLARKWMPAETES